MKSGDIRGAGDGLGRCRHLGEHLPRPRGPLHPQPETLTPRPSISNPVRNNPSVALHRAIDKGLPQGPTGGLFLMAMGWDVADIWGSISLDLAVPDTRKPDPQTLIPEPETPNPKLSNRNCEPLTLTCQP